MFSRSRHANIAVGDHADDALAVGYNRQYAAIVPPHLHRRIGQVGFRPTALHIFGHYIFYFHVFPFFLNIENCYSIAGSIERP